MANYNSREGQSYLSREALSQIEGVHPLKKDEIRSHISSVYNINLPKKGVYSQRSGSHIRNPSRDRKPQRQLRIVKKAPDQSVSPHVIDLSLANSPQFNSQVATPKKKGAHYEALSEENLSKLRNNLHSKGLQTTNDDDPYLGRSGPISHRKGPSGPVSHRSSLRVSQKGSLRNSLPHRNNANTITLAEAISQAEDKLSSRRGSVTRLASTEESPFLGRQASRRCTNFIPNSSCDSLAYHSISLPLCKHHFLKYLKMMLRREFRNLYRHSDIAFGSLDMTGTGFVTMDGFMESIVCKRIEEQTRRQQLLNLKNKLSVTRRDIREFLVLTNIFDQQSRVNYQAFKKFFFPQLCHATLDEKEADDMDSQKGKEERKAKSQLKQDKNGEIIKDRIANIERVLKKRLSNNYDSVRKAFLDLDVDHDGFITIEDFLRNFGDNKDLNFIDLKKLIESRDHFHRGKISYEDFSAWMGNCIHMSEGFYFRHDSIKNPQYEKNSVKISEQAKYQDQVRQELTSIDLVQTIIRKISSQWKTIRKAFSDMNKDTTESGIISKAELKFYFDHWGLKMTPKQFDEVYNLFDVDKDGKISYNDFHQSVGSEIHPGETLYFRQDKPSIVTQKKCAHFQCWSATCGNGNYCTLHNKMHQDDVEKFYASMFRLADKSKWDLFSKMVKKASSPEDNHKLIELSRFEDIVNKILGMRLADDQRNLLFNTSGRIYNGKKFINISMIYSQNFLLAMRQLYSSLEIEENEEDDAVDAAGYTGNFRREQPSNWRKCSFKEFILLFKSSKGKLSELMRLIKSIDRDHNGYVTVTECDDILKIIFSPELDQVNLKNVLKYFCSSANKVLLDYKQLKSFLEKNISLQEEAPVFFEKDRYEKIHEESKRKLNKDAVKLNPTQEHLAKLKEAEQEKLQTTAERQKEWMDMMNGSAERENEMIKSPPKMNSMERMTAGPQVFTQQPQVLRKLEPRLKGELPSVGQDPKRQGHSLNRTQETIPREGEFVYKPSPSVPLTDKSVIFRQQGDKKWVRQLNSQLGLTSFSKIKQGGSMQKRSSRYNSFTDRHEDPTVDSERGYFSNRLMSQTCFGKGEAFKVPSIHSNQQANIYGLPDAAKKGKRLMKSFYGKNQLAPAVAVTKDLRPASFQRIRYPHCETSNLIRNKKQYYEGLPNLAVNQTESRMEVRKLPEKTTDPNSANKAFSVRDARSEACESNLVVRIRPMETDLPKKQMVIKERLGYSWKSIYRFLSNKDRSNEGKIPMAVFEEALQQTKTYLSKQDMTQIVTHYGSKDHVDYDLISSEVMGIKQGTTQKQNFDKMRQTHLTLQRIRSDLGKLKTKY